MEMGVVQSVKVRLCVEMETFNAARSAIRGRFVHHSMVWVA